MKNLEMEFICCHGHDLEYVSHMYYAMFVYIVFFTGWGVLEEIESISKP